MKDVVRTHTLGSVLVRQDIALLVAKCLLLVIVTPFTHAFVGEEIVENDFTPVTLSLVLASERICKTIRLITD